MSEELLKIVSAQGVWAILSFVLIFYILKEQEKRDEKQIIREESYHSIIKELTQKFEEIYDEIKLIKEIIKEK